MNITKETGDMNNLMQSLRDGQNQLCVIISNCDEIIKNGNEYKL